MTIIEFNIHFVLILSFALGMQWVCLHNYLLFISQHKKVLIKIISV